MPRLLFRLLLALLAWAALPGGAWSAGTGLVEPPHVWPDYAVGARWWEDPGGLASFEEARLALAAGHGRIADPHDVMPIGGGKAVWYRIDLPAATGAPRVVLTLPNPGLDRVDFHVQDARGDWKMQTAGDSVPVSQWPVPFLQPSFAFNLQPQPQAAYLRVQNVHDLGVSWVLRDVRGFSETVKSTYLLLGVGGGFLALVVVLSLLNSVSWRDPSHLYFAVHALLVALSFASIRGVAGEHWWPDDPWLNDIMAVCLPTALVAWLALFVRALVCTRGMRLLSRVLVAHSVLGMLVIAALLLFGRGAAFALHNIYVVSGLAVLLGVLGWHASLRRMDVVLVLAGLVALTAGGMFLVLRNLGVLPLSGATQQAPIVGWALEITLVLAGLHYHSRTLRDNRLRLQARARIDPLTGAVNHATMIPALDQLLRDARDRPSSGAVLRVRVANLDAIRKVHGPEAAEAAVVRAAECVGFEAGAHDLLAREKGGDLVLLLAGEVKRWQAVEAGRNVIARGLKFSGRLPPNVTLALHVALAAAPLPAASGKELLAELEELVADITRSPNGRSLRVFGGAEGADTGTGAITRPGPAQPSGEPAS